MASQTRKPGLGVPSMRGGRSAPCGTGRPGPVERPKSAPSPRDRDLVEARSQRRAVAHRQAQLFWICKLSAEACEVRLAGIATGSSATPTPRPRFARRTGERPPAYRASVHSRFGLAVVWKVIRQMSRDRSSVQHRARPVAGKLVHPSAGRPPGDACQRGPVALLPGPSGCEAHSRGNTRPFNAADWDRAGVLSCHDRPRQACGERSRTRMALMYGQVGLQSRRSTAGRASVGGTGDRDSTIVNIAGTAPTSVCSRHTPYLQPSSYTGPAGRGSDCGVGPNLQECRPGDAIEL